MTLLDFQVELNLIQLIISLILREMHGYLSYITMQLRQITAHVIVNSDRCNDVQNVSFQVMPTVGGRTGFSCTTAGCDVDLNSDCPNDLKVSNDTDVVACMSS
jgi:hypothetical protein